MKKLLQTAFSTQRQKTLIFISIAFMIFLTFTTQLEIIALGVIARKGPDFFELFASKEKNVDQTVSKNEFEKTWNAIDTENKGIITKEDVDTYLVKENRSDII